MAAQVGTALLLADEAGTNSAHRVALKNPLFATTVVTRAFSGRYARGLENDFTRMLDHVAPLGYPEVNQMTSPIREAAAAMRGSQRDAAVGRDVVQARVRRPSGRHHRQSRGHQLACAQRSAQDGRPGR